MNNHKGNLKKLIAFAISAVMLIASIQSGIRDASADEGNSLIEFNVTYGQTEARSMLTEINKWRTSDVWYWNEDNTTKKTISGLKELQFDARLEKIAMQRAAEIALSFSHTRPSAENTWTAYGSISEYGAVGENIAAGQKNAAQAFDSWKEEDEPYAYQGHRRNMLNENFNYIGIAHVYVNGYHYWVQEFSRTTDDAALSPAIDSLTKASVSINGSVINNAKVTIEPSSISLNLSDNTTCTLPSAKAAVLTNDAWPEAYMTLESPLPEWKVLSGNAVTIDGGTIKAVQAGTSLLSATIVIAGKTFSSDCTVTVSASAANPSAEPMRNPGSNTTPAPTHTPDINTPPAPTRIPSNSTTTAPSKTQPGNISTPAPAANTEIYTYSPVKKISSLTVKNKKGRKAAVSWKKVNEVYRYQLQYSLNKKFTGSAKIINVTKTKYTIKSLKKKKTYFIRVRALRKIGLSTEYGKWSNIKKVKIKK